MGSFTVALDFYEKLAMGYVIKAFGVSRKPQSPNFLSDRDQAARDYSTDNKMHFRQAKLAFRADPTEPVNELRGIPWQTFQDYISTF